MARTRSDYSEMEASQADFPEIRSPEDVRLLPEGQLPALAARIRHTLINSLSKTGGHLGPNLGVVELSIALHRVFETPRDRFVFDVSHQGYVHKMLTGRWPEIHTIRQYGGLNGYFLRTESEHDSYGAGHAGTAVSAALGMAVGRDLAGGNEHIVCVAGDAAFTCGPTLEALNNVAEHTKKFLLILNDNEWSIDRNVGALARYFNHIATNSTYSHLHGKAAEFVEKVLGKRVRRLAGKVEEGAKNLFFENILFEEFGMRYYGPIDGHDLPALIKTLEFLKKQEEPVVLHIITEKGRGYDPALDNPGKFHGLGPYQIDTGETPAAELPTYSDIFGRTVTDLAKLDERIVAITAAMPGGTKLSTFKDEIPERYFDVGIAEEHAALFACGLATQGLRPFLTIYSTFMQRAYDMIIHDIALQNLPVRLCMDRGGLSGDDGPTHHGLFDIGYLRHVPNLVHMQAKDEAEFGDMLYTMSLYDEGPIAIRYPRGAGVGAKHDGVYQQLTIGEAEVVADGTDVALFGLGYLFEMAEETRRLLEARGLSVALVNPRWIKPLDGEVIERYGRKCRVICTFEDHVLTHGFGASVIEHLHDAGIYTPVARIGWPDEFIEHGPVATLRQQHGLSAGHAVDKIVRLLAQAGSDAVSV